MLHISSAQIQAIKAHAQFTYPEECCGLLLGQLARQDNRDIHWVQEVWATENTWNQDTAAAVADLSQAQQHPTKEHHYWIDPKTMLAAQRYAHQKNLDLIGIYHSHPDHPAIPSECDRMLAWSQYSYIIVSVQQGNATDLRCWSLDPHNEFQSEEIVLV